MNLSSARTGLLAIVFFALGPALGSLGVAPPLVGFGLFALGGLLGLVALLTGIRTWIGRGIGIAAGNLVLGGLVTVAFAAIAVPGRGFPRINDITTDTTNPPAFLAARNLPENQGRDLTYPGESFAEQQREGYPGLQARATSLPPQEAFRRVETEARAQPNWEITRADPEHGAIEGFATSRLFRFKDDFVIEVRPAAEGGGSVIHMRSKSRDGRGDIGANAARIESFLGALSNLPD